MNLSYTYLTFRLIAVLWLTVVVTHGAPSPQSKNNFTGGSKNNSTGGNFPSKPNVPPVIKQCFYESRWFPAGTIISAGRSGDWCFGSYCDIDGHVKHWDDYKCPPSDNANPPFPDLNKLRQQTTTTVRPTQPQSVAPPTPRFTAPPSFWVQTTTMQPFNFNFNFNFDQMGCFYRGQFYWAGQDIENRRRGRRCMGTYCDFNGVLQHWSDDCRFTVPPPTVQPPTRPPGRRRPRQRNTVET